MDVCASKHVCTYMCVCVTDTLWNQGGLAVKLWAHPRLYHFHPQCPLYSCSHWAKLTLHPHPSLFFSLCSSLLLPPSLPPSIHPSTHLFLIYSLYLIFPSPSFHLSLFFLCCYPLPTSFTVFIFMQSLHHSSISNFRTLDTTYPQARSVHRSISTNARVCFDDEVIWRLKGGIMKERGNNWHQIQVKYVQKVF